MTTRSARDRALPFVGRPALLSHAVGETLEARILRGDWGPGERITQETLDYLTTGVRAGMLVPDAADSSLETLRVVAD